MIRHRRLPRLAPGMVSPLLLLAVLVLPLTPATAGDSDYRFRAGDAAGDTTEEVEVGLYLENDGEDLLGWSMAVCHDVDVVTLLEVVTTDVIDSIKDGDPPDLSEITIYEDGFVAGVVICLTSCAALAPGDEEQLYTVTYSLDVLAPATAEISFCDDTLPAVDNLVVLDGGDDLTPELTSGTVTIEGPDPLHYHLLTENVDVVYDAVNGEAAFELPVAIAGDKNDPDFPQPVDAVVLSLLHDAELLLATGVLPGSAVDDLADGAGADFFTSTIEDDGVVVVEIVVDEDGEVTLPAENPAEVAIISYETIAPALRFNLVGRDTEVAWNEDPDASAAPNRISVEGFFVGVRPDEGSTVKFIPEERFRRGDVDGDGETSFGDALGLLVFLFAEGTINPCDDAADINDDDRISLADPLRLLIHIFLEGDPPAAPYPDCGFDTTGAAHCQTYNECR